MPSETVRVALLTPPGRGALAVVGVAGRDALAAVTRLFVPRGTTPLGERPDGAVVFGRWGDAERGEELVVVRGSAERLEVHCHGGLAASAAVIASLEAGGAVRQSWPEWLAATGASAIEREAREALARVGGPKAAQILCRQLAGALEAELAQIAALAAGGDVAGATAAGERLRRAARVGLRLTRPWRVVVAGAVNAGKSSLVNALAGHARSIVSAEPGTTRDVLETRLVLDGWEIDLIDTAGLRDAPAGPTEAAGIERARAAAASADLVVHVIDGSDRPPAGSRSDRPPGLSNHGATGLQAYQKEAEFDRAGAPSLRGQGYDSPGAPSLRGAPGPDGRVNSSRRSRPSENRQDADVSREDSPGAPSLRGAPGPEGRVNSSRRSRPSENRQDADVSREDSPGAPSPRQTLLVLTKCELVPSHSAVSPDTFRTSALTGLGIDALAAEIVRRLIPEERGDPTLLAGAVPFTHRQVELLG